MIYLYSHHPRYIQPICLPTGNMTSRDLTGSYVSALGWGSTHYGGDEVSKLNQVSLPVWTQRDCDDAYFQVVLSGVRNRFWRNADLVLVAFASDP